MVHHAFPLLAASAQRRSSNPLHRFAKHPSVRCKLGRFHLPPCSSATPDILGCSTFVLYKLGRANVSLSVNLCTHHNPWHLYRCFKKQGFLFCLSCAHVHMHICLWECPHGSAHVWGQRIAYRRWFSPSIFWVLGLELRASGLAARSFTW